MDDSRPPVLPSEFRLRPASGRTPADIDPAPAVLAKLDQLAAVERQNRFGRIEPCTDDFSDETSVAIYYRNEQEVREGFLIALSAMGVAGAEQLPEPTKPPVRGTKP
jgi:hypothetical protein